MSSNCCDIRGAEPERLKLQVVSTAICLIATLGGWLLPLSGLAAANVPSLVVAYVAGGWHPLQRAYGAMRCGKLDVDLLMLLAAAGAAVVGHMLEGAVLLFLFSLGNTLETYAFRRTRRSIQALVELSPERAARIDADGEESVLLEELALADLVRVRPGERIPIDGVVRDGTSHVDESTLTGEPVPVSKAEGSVVFAGTLNGSGSLDVEVTRVASDTTLARIIELVEEARESQAPTQGWIEAMESRYAVGVIAAAALAVIVPWLLLGWSFDDAFYRAMTLLVVASPCALVISIPATIVSAVSNGARNGILFKGGAYLDALSSVTAFALDKTGTVTVGHPEVAAIRVRSHSGVAVGPTEAWGDSDTGSRDDRVLSVVAAAESRSEHHLAAAIVRAAQERGVDMPDVTDFSSTPGQGVTATVAGDEVRVGRRSWIEEHVGMGAPEELTSLFEADFPGATPVYVAVNGAHTAALAVEDRPRTGVADALSALRSAGVTHTAMLTGDAWSTAKDIARDLDIDEVHAELRPNDKSHILGEIRARHGPVAMVGDGVNDAPALATADVGIALGVAGTDVALETADVVVMGEGLDSLARAVRLSHRTRTVVRQNLVFAVTVMIGLVAAALMGWIGLTAGVIGHEGSTIVVVFNGLRLLADGRR